MDNMRCARRQRQDESRRERPRQERDTKMKSGPFTHYSFNRLSMIMRSGSSPTGSAASLALCGSQHPNLKKCKMHTNSMQLQNRETETFWSVCKYGKAHMMGARTVAAGMQEQASIYWTGLHSFNIKQSKRIIMTVSHKTRMKSATSAMQSEILHLGLP